MRLLIYLLVIIGVIGCNASSSDSEEDGSLNDATSKEKTELEEITEKAIAYLSEVPFDSLQIPRTVENGSLKGTPSKSWTSGFYPGILWQLYGFSKNEKLKI